MKIAAILSRAGLPAVGALFFYPVMTLWDVGAWRLLFPRECSSRARFADLFWIRLAGEALNNVTPFLDIGGEPLKARLLAHRFQLSSQQAVASTVVAKTSVLISQAAFLLMGAALSFVILPLPADTRVGILALLLAVCFIFIGFLYLQRKGAFHKMNPEISRFYSVEGERFWSAVSLNWMGWLFGGVETTIFCWLAGMNISFLEGLMLEGLLQLVRTGSFFIPMNLGAQEWGLAFFTALMGFEPAAGVGISLLKRSRQILWTATGFAVWGVYRYIVLKRESS